MKEHFKESVFPHTRELSIYTECESTEASGVHISDACPHVKYLESNIQPIGGNFTILMISLPLTWFFVPWFGENIWIDDEHCPYWDVVKSKSGVLPKRIYPTRQIETLRLLRCDAVGRKNAAKLINCKLPSGVFSKLAFLRAGSKHWKLWQQKGSGIVDWKHLLNKHSIGCTYALHQFNSNQIVIDWKRFGLKGWIRLNRKHFQPIWACTFVCTWVLVYF